MFDRVVERIYNDLIIQYGIIDGTEKNTILFIKAGQNGSCYGYRNKYLRIAKRIQKKYGITVISSSNPFKGGNPMDDAIGLIKDYCLQRSWCFKDISIYYMGISNGAIIGAWYGFLYPEIKRMLLINMPIGVSHWHVTKARLGYFTQSAGIIDVVYGEFDESYPYIDLFKPLEGENLRRHTIESEDHNFTFKMEDFLSLPEEYLLNDMEPIISPVKISVMPRKAIERDDYDGAIIFIDNEENISSNINRIDNKLILKVLDIEDSHVGGAFSDEDAIKVKTFINRILSKKTAGELVDILCACEAGISRSAAMAASLYLYLIGPNKDIDPIWDNPCYHPNRLVFTKMNAVLDTDSSLKSSEINKRIIINQNALSREIRKNRRYT